MKAIEYLKREREIKKHCADVTWGYYDKDIDEAIKELEALQNENKSLVKTLEKYNEEMIDLRKENHSSKPILFNTEMVKAILDGRKTQTRRVVNKEYLGMADIDDNNIYVTAYDGGYVNILNTSWSKYKVGDVLYVRETFYPLYNDEDSCVYKADYPLHWTAVDAVYGDIETDTETEKRTVWKPSIHMPKKYARIFLKVTNVRVERLQDVKYSDIEKELGVNADNYKQYTSWSDLMACDFKDTWNSTAKDGYKYLDNPYVFVYEFERIKK